MENRRPPRANSSGRKPYFDRGQGAPSHRGGKFRGDGKPKPNRWNDGNTSEQRGDTDRNRRPPYDPQRADRPQGGNFKRNDGPGFGRRKFPPRPGQDRMRPGAAKRPQVDDSVKITSDGQITDGKFRGRTLLGSDSPSALPTPRKVREIVFRMISRRVKAHRFLDLGAGVGTIGIEAISRGGMLSTFVDRSARCCNLVRKNLDAFGIKDGHGELVEMEIIPFLIRSAKRRRFWELVYLDVPNGDERTQIVERLSRGVAISPGGLLMIAHPADAPHPENLNQLKRWRTVDQGETIVSIYERI